MTLKNCIKSTVGLSEEDTAAVLSAVDSGMSVAKAVDAVIAQVEGEITESIQLITEQNPELTTGVKQIVNGIYQVDSVLRNKDGSYRKNDKGDISGAPAGVKTEAQVKDIVKGLVSALDHPFSNGANSFMWYENSGAAIRRLSHGDKDLMESVVRLGAFYSQANQVGGNTTALVSSLVQYMRGDKEIFAGRFPNKTSPLIRGLLEAKNFDPSIPGVEQKVMSFYRNLHDAAFNENKYSDATIDMWMYALLGYEETQLGGGQAPYRFVKAITDEVTAEYNVKHKTKYKPHNIQAALWSYIKNSQAAGEHLIMGKKFTIPKTVGFNTYLDRASAHVPYETRPSVDSGLMPWIHDAPIEAMEQYHQEAVELTQGPGGVDTLLAMSNAALYQNQVSRGTFEGAQSPNTITTVPLDKKITGYDKDGEPIKDYDPDVADLYSIAMQYIYTQDGVGWFRLSSQASGPAGVVVQFKENPTTKDVDNLRSAVGKDMTIVNGNAVFVDFMSDDRITENKDGTFTLDMGEGVKPKEYKQRWRAEALLRKEFINDVMDGLDNYPDSDKIEASYQTRAENKYHGHDWKEDPEGQKLIDALASRGSPDIVKWASDRRRAVEALQKDFSQRQGQAKVAQPVSSYNGNYPARGNDQQINEQLQLSLHEDMDIALSQATGNLLLTNINAEAKTTGTVSLVGKTITSPEEFATMAQVWRDPRWETMRWVFVDSNGEVKGHVGISQRLPGSSTAFPVGGADRISWLKEQMESSGATRIWMMHNHPSGNPKPSPDDILFTNQMVSAGLPINGHVIIDSNKYAVLDTKLGPNQKHQVYDKDFYDGQPDPILKRTGDPSYIGFDKQKAGSFDAMAHLASMLNDHNNMQLVGLNPDLTVGAIREVPRSVLDSKDLNSLIYGFAKETGSIRTSLLNVPDAANERLAFLIQEGYLIDAIDINGRSTHTSNRIFKSGAEYGKLGGDVDVTMIRQPAHHGSPYLFDRFSMENIGTGEGAQAYGHGLYFAENPKVAGSYREGLSEPATENFQVGSLMQAKGLTEHDARVIVRGINRGLEPRKAVEAASDVMSIDNSDFIDANIDQLTKYATEAKNAPKQGHLYEVDIPDEHVKNFLDWDKPLSQQPESVKKAYRNTKMPESQKAQSTSGAGLHANLRNFIHDKFPNINRAQADKLTSEYLNSLGIKGIKYKDAMSRGTGEGTNNLVVFDESIITITKINGKPVDLGVKADIDPYKAGEVGKKFDQEYAGNIKKSKFRNPDVPSILQSTYNQNASRINKARRGTVSWPETEALAQDLGMSIEDLKRRRRGKAFNAEELDRARALTQQSAESVMDAARSGNRGDLVKAMAAHAEVQAKYSGAVAEAGRALQILRKQTLELKEVNRIVNDVFKGDPDRAVEMIDAFETTGQVSKFTRDIFKPGASDILLEIWINALLSGPQTHAVNIMSNALVQVYTVLEDQLAALGGALRGSDKVTLRDSLARAMGILKGAGDGAHAAYKAFKTEEPNDPSTKLELDYRAIRAESFGMDPRSAAGKMIDWTGRKVRVPGRALTAMDEFYKAMSTRGTIAQLATRIALSKGMKGKALAEEIQRLSNTPTDEMMAKAKQQAAYTTFTNQLGPLGQSVQNMVAKVPALRLIAPFIRTPTNILKFALHRSPIAPLFKDVRADLRGENGKVERDMAWARVIMGTGIGYMVAKAAMDGLVSGGGPDDPTKKAMKYAQGWQPYSIYHNGKWYSYQRLEPLGMIFGVSADFVEIMGQMDEEEVDNVAGLIVGSIAKNLTSKTWLRGVSEFVRMLDDPDRYGGRYVQQLTGTVVPTGVAQWTRTQDPTMREARTIIDNIKSRASVDARKELPPRRDPFGEPITREGGVGPDIISPVYTSTVKDNPVAKEIEELGISLGKPSRKFKDVELTDEQYDQYANLRGKYTKNLLDSVVRSAGYMKMPAWARKKTLEDLIRKARDQAEVSFVINNPDVLNASQQQKVDQFREMR